MNKKEILTKIEIELNNLDIYSYGYLRTTKEICLDFRNFVTSENQLFTLEEYRILCIIWRLR